MKKIIMFVIALMFVIGMMGSSVIGESDKTTREPIGGKTLQQKKTEIERLGSELEEACKKHGKFRISMLSNTLIHYGELSIPVFTKLMWSKNSEVANIGEWGLGEIKSQKAVDVLIEKFRYDERNNKKGFGTIEALGKIGGGKAKKFLEEHLDKKDGTEIVTAWALLHINKRHKKAEDILIESMRKNKRIKATMIKVPSFSEYRRDGVIDISISILMDPKISEWNWIDEIISAADVLIKTKYEKADNVLIKAFDVQKNDIGRAFILRNLAKLKSDKAKNFLKEINNKSEKEIGLFLKEKIKEIMAGERSDSK